MNNLESIHRNLQELKNQVQENPLQFARFTPAQEAFLSCREKFYLLRGGNQIGKSYAGAAECIMRATGKHRFKPVTSPPVQVWVICHSWSQSVEIQNRIWDLLPKNEVVEKTVFSPARGFHGSGTPVVSFRNGSIIRIKTTQQTGGSSKGTIALASGTVDFVLVDEPCGPLVWSELVGRVLRKRGQIAITMTPVGVDCSHIKKLCDDGIMKDIQAPLTVQNVTPRDCDPLLSKNEIDEITRSYMEFDREIRISGAWEGYAPHGVIFKDFRPEFISDALPPTGNYQYAVGIDHGSQEGAQFAVLIAVRIPDPTEKKSGDYFLYVLDEYQSGAAKADTHAKGILSMLKRNRLEPNNIFRWVGDRPHRGDKYGSRMSNKMLRASFAHILGYPPGSGFTIHTAYKPAFSVYYGIRALHELMQKNNFQIHPRCVGLIKSLRSWAILKSGQLDKNSEYKHGIDALRYASLQILSKEYRQPRKTHIKIIR